MGCESCKSDGKETFGKISAVPFIVYESTMARSERAVKRWWIALLIALVLLFVSNAAWLYCWMQYDYTGENATYTQDGEGINIIGDRNAAEAYDYGTDSD